MKKLIICALIGMFGTQKNEKQFKDLITISKQEAHYYFYKYTEKGMNVSLRDFYLEDGTTVYRLTVFKPMINFTTNYFIRKQIVERANVSMYQVRKLLENSKLYRPLKIKTDCIYYAMREKDAKYPVPKNPQIGDLRNEKVKDMKEFEQYTLRDIPRRDTIIPEEVEWDITTTSKTEMFDYKKILEFDRVFVEGSAGTAKSVFIRKLKEELKDDFLYTSFTHTASNNIEGETLHHGFGVNHMTDSANPKQFSQILKKKKGIIIDEVNQCPKSIFRILVQLPREFKIYAFGDHRQELPVKETKHFIETKMFMLLMHCNKIILSKQCRADAKYADACARYHDLLANNQKTIIMDEFIRVNDGSIEHDYNIVKTNLCRCVINERMMFKYKPAECEKLEPTDKNKESQTMYLYEGLPLICNFTKKKNALHLYNGEQFIIKSIEDNYVYLETRQINKDIQIKTMSLTKDNIAEYSSPCYAFTSYKAEGLTIGHPYTIWEFNSMHYKTKYTALTRATSSTNVYINKDNLNLMDLEVKSDNIARIYIITDGEQQYIGSTRRTIQERFEEHKESKENTKLYRYMRNKGVDKFFIHELYEFNYVSKHHIERIEKYFIQKHDTIERGLNMRLP